jgi:hypothetical protein
MTSSAVTTAQSCQFQSFKDYYLVIGLLIRLFLNPYLRNVHTSP